MKYEYKYFYTTKIWKMKRLIGEMLIYCWESTEMKIKQCNINDLDIITQFYQWQIMG